MFVFSVIPAAGEYAGIPENKTSAFSAVGNPTSSFFVYTGDSCLFVLEK